MALIKESSKSASERPGLATGGLVAAMLTAALISVFYLAWKVVGLPFVPFDAFDWMAHEWLITLIRRPAMKSL